MSLLTFKIQGQGQLLVCCEKSRLRCFPAQLERRPSHVTGGTEYEDISAVPADVTIRPLTANHVRIEDHTASPIPMNPYVPFVAFFICVNG
jgi:hypothetical protein